MKRSNLLRGFDRSVVLAIAAAVAVLVAPAVGYADAMTDWNAAASSAITAAGQSPHASTLSIAGSAAIASDRVESTRISQASEEHPDQVLEWNQVFIDTLIATNTANSSSQRLGAIVHTAIFDAYNGVERRYTPIFVHDQAPAGARAERQSSLRRIRRWSACSRPGSRSWMPAMRRRWRR